MIWPCKYRSHHKFLKNQGIERVKSNKDDESLGGLKKVVRGRPNITTSLSTL